MKENKFIPFNEAYKKLNNIIMEKDPAKKDLLPWIFVKVLRIKKNAFNKITKVDSVQFDLMEKALYRCLNGETLSEIFGFIEFYGEFFYVTKNVFDPRLSTESLVKAVISSMTCHNNTRMLDICTGSGCVAIMLSKLTKSKVDGVDISRAALKMARKNNLLHETSTAFFEMDVLKDWEDSLVGEYDIIVSNPPYWSSDKIFNSGSITRGNPKRGFLGGKDGMKFHRSIIEKSPDFLKRDGKLFLEMDEEQEEKIRIIMEDNNFRNIETFTDYRGFKRVISGEIEK